MRRPFWRHEARAAAARRESHFGYLEVRTQRTTPTGCPAAADADAAAAAAAAADAAAAAAWRKKEDEEEQEGEEGE